MTLARINAELLEENERYRLLADTMLHGIVHQDALGGIIAMNPAAEQILGKSRQRFLGSTSVEEERDTVREDGSIFPGIEHPSMVALKTGQPVRGTVMGVWNPARQERRWIRIDAVPIFRKDELKPIEVYAVFEDITDRRAIKEELRLTTDRFKLALKSSSITLYSQDLDLKYTWVYNPSGGYDPSLFVGRSDLDICEVREQAIALETIKRKVIETGISRREEVVIQLSGQERYFDLLVDPLLDSSSKIAGVTCASVDVTQRKQIEKALKEADRQKDEFLATLAHELRNPLAPIRTSVEILKLIGPNEPVLKQSWEVIDRQVKHMTRLLEDLLDVSRITRNKLDLRLEQIELIEVIRMAMETSQPLIDDRNHRLEILIPSQSILLTADPIRLSQAFANLLNNAAKYTEARGTIRLQATLHEQEVAVAIQDSGIGITPDMLSKVFEIFTQASSVLHQTQGGLGIGLSLVKGLIALHGGRVEAASDGLGHGSTFTVRLPLAISSATNQLPIANRTCSESSNRLIGKRVLVADDLRDNADSLGLMMKAMGCDVYIAYSGEEAIVKANEYRPDFIFLDIGMPTVNGYEAASRIRSTEWGKYATIIALTGWAREEDRAKTKESGFDHHLSKPLNIQTLKSLLGTT